MTHPDVFDGILKIRIGYEENYVNDEAPLTQHVRVDLIFCENLVQVGVTSHPALHGHYEGERERKFSVELVQSERGETPSTNRPRHWRTSRQVNYPTITYSGNTTNRVSYSVGPALQFVHACKFLQIVSVSTPPNRGLPLPSAHKLLWEGMARLEKDAGRNHHCRQDAAPRAHPEPHDPLR